MNVNLVSRDGRQDGELMRSLALRAQIGVCGLPIQPIFAYNNKGELVRWESESGEVLTCVDVRDTVKDLVRRCNQADQDR